MRHGAGQKILYIIIIIIIIIIIWILTYHQKHCYPVRLTLFFKQWQNYKIDKLVE